MPPSRRVTNPRRETYQEQNVFAIDKVPSTNTIIADESNFPLTTEPDPTHIVIQNVATVEAQQIIHDDHNIGYAVATPPNACIFALVIGIDNYKNRTIPPLKGCALDAEAFVNFLGDTLHVPSDNIVILFNEEATRAAIIAAFRKHFLDNEGINAGDAMVLFYAGHGDRAVAPRGWVTSNGMIEMICPYDAETTDEHSGKPIYGIPDRTLNSLMRHLAYKKGDNIVAIFDSCHSGGAFRNMRPGPGTPRELGKDVRRYTLPATLDEELMSLSADTEDGSRGATQVISSGFSYPTMRSHVLLAACREDEKARENIVHDGGTEVARGMFTYHLLAYLRRAYEEAHAPPQITYARLMEALLDPENIKLCGASFIGQNPLCEGKNRDRLLFSTSEVAGEATSFPLRYDNRTRTLYVVGGHANGVVEGTEFTVQLALTDQIDGLVRSRDIVLVVKTVYATECVVRHDQITDLSPYVEALKKARAIISTWNSIVMKVRTPTPLPAQAAFKYEKATPKGSGYYDLSLQELSNCRILTRSDPLTFRYAEREMTIPGRSLQPDEILDAVAHWNFHLYRFNDRVGGSQELRPQVGLHLLETASGTGLRPLLSQVGEDLFGSAPAEDVRGCPLSTYTVPVKVKEARIHDLTKYYGLTLINTSAYDLYPYVFYFDPSTYGIQAWYLPPGERVRAPLPRSQGRVPGQLPIGYGAGEADSIRFSLAPGAKREAGFLKIFVSTSYVDMRSLRQNDLVDRERGANKETITIPGGAWDASVYVLTCFEPE
ncbi:hypothetical protein DAEQUDRAFT_764535 [Daedalea quercina L-15889]|uniref:Peptidase C14 caspase domain-containing protein n=1 Tax=Daedalea quercina L-15889 TaxID=1314783 RepID=A0A165RF18_9APHY|nr:hypothetical protein DAEQUDRAFT_764535 [Daedalea quercina L-15889]